MPEICGGDTPTQRISWLSTKISQAQNQTRTDGADVLKVFMAPEWFFRKRTGNYSEKERDGLIKQEDACTRALRLAADEASARDGQRCPQRR